MAIVSIVLGSYNRKPFLKAAIGSIRRDVAEIPHEIIVVDGGSRDGSLEWLMRQKDIVTIVQHNRGKWQGKDIERKSWGYFMNLGFKSARGKYILMVSDDCLLVPGSTANGIKQFEAALAEGRKVGAVAFYWRNWPEEKKYRIELTLGDKMFVNHGLYLRDAFEEIGWADEAHYKFYHGDGDLCLKLWNAGYETVECKGSFVEHFSHAGLKLRRSNKTSQKMDWQKYLDRWSGIYYDPKRNNVGGPIHHESLAGNTYKYFPFAEVIKFRIIRACAYALKKVQVL